MSITSSHNENEPISSQFGKTKFSFFCLSLGSCIPCLNPAPLFLVLKNCTLMLAPVLRRKVVPEKWVTLPTESTLASLYLRKKGDPFLRANNARAHALIVQNGASACSDCLALTKLTRLGEPKCFYEEKLVRLGG